MNTKLPLSVLAFAKNEEDRLQGYKNFKEYYDMYKNNKSVDANGVTFEEKNDIMLNFYKDEIERLSKMKISDTEDLKVYCGFTAVKEAAFAIMGMLTDLVMPDALIKDLSAIAEFKNGGWGDTLKIDLKPRDLFVISKGGRARRTYDITRQYNGEKTIVPEVHGITVGISLYDVLRGAYTLAEFVSKAALSLEVNIRYDIYDAFAAAMNALPTTAGAAQLHLTGFSQDAAISLAQKVEAWNYGNKAVFLGTKLALSKILPASTNVRILLGDEYVKVGYIREFFGFSAVEMEQVADYTTEFGLKLDDEKIYIVSPGTDKIVKVFFEGSTLSNVEGNYANADLENTATLYKSYGVAVATSAIAGVIDL